MSFANFSFGASFVAALLLASAGCGNKPANSDAAKDSPKAGASAAPSPTAAKSAVLVRQDDSKNVMPTLDEPTYGDLPEWAKSGWVASDEAEWGYVIGEAECASPVIGKVLAARAAKKKLAGLGAEAEAQGEFVAAHATAAIDGKRITRVLMRAPRSFMGAAPRRTPTPGVSATPAAPAPAWVSDPAWIARQGESDLFGIGTGKTLEQARNAARQALVAAVKKLERDSGGFFKVSQTSALEKCVNAGEYNDTVKSEWKAMVKVARKAVIVTETDTPTTPAQPTPAAPTGPPAWTTTAGWADANTNAEWVYAVGSGPTLEDAKSAAKNAMVKSAGELARAESKRVTYAMLREVDPHETYVDGGTTWVLWRLAREDLIK
jgi:hypothetical protein